MKLLLATMIAAPPSARRAHSRRLVAGAIFLRVMPSGRDEDMSSTKHNDQVCSCNVFPMPCNCSYCLQLLPHSFGSPSSIH